MILKLIFGPARTSRGTSLLFGLIVAFGLIGILLLHLLQTSVDTALQGNSRRLMGADLSVSGRRPLNEKEISQIQSIVGSFPQATSREIYSMGTAGRTRLLHVRGLAQEFPFYGNYKIKGPRGLVTQTGRDLGSDQIWIGPELESQMGVRIGDVIRIGDVSYHISGVVEEDNGALWGGFSLAPRVYVADASLDRTGLLQTGSLVTYSTYWKTPPMVDLNQITDQVAKVLVDPGIRVTSHMKASEQSARFLSYFNDFLGLIALMALLLTSVGLGFLAQSLFQSRIKELAILNALGVSRGRAEAMVAAQVSALSGVSALLSLGLAILVVQPIGKWISMKMGMSIPIALDWNVLGLALFLGPIWTLLILWPEVRKLRDLPTSQLFRESTGLNWGQTKRSWKDFFLPALIFWGLSILQAHSMRIGTFFAVSVMVALLISWWLAAVLLGRLEKIKVTGANWRMSVRALARHRGATASAFVAICLGVMVLTMIPQIYSSIIEQFRVRSSAPSLFLFDIQPEQTSELSRYLSEGGHTLGSLSPMVRARLESVNGDSFAKGNVSENRFFREDEQEDRTRNRAYNLTWRSSLTASEFLVRGKEFSKYSGSGPAEISLEYRFADRLGVSIGDLLGFDIEGVKVEGRVVSLRRVRWTDFQPNFFITFQDGVLADAPQTWLASVSGLSAAAKDSVQMEIAEKFPNISMIDVDMVVTRLMGLVRLLAFILSGMSILALLAGLAVFTGISLVQAERRQADIRLVKLLGGRLSQLRRLALEEGFLLVSVALVLGMCMGLIIAWLIMRTFFDGTWNWSGLSLGAMIIGVPLLFMCVSGILNEISLRRSGGSSALDVGS